MPKAAPRPCPKHPSILVTKDSPCPNCPKHGWRHSKTSSQRGYGAAWRKIRLVALKRDNHLCQVCLKTGKYTPAEEVDHIDSNSQNNALDNLQSICTQCHRAKTEKERTTEGRGDQKSTAS